MPQPAPGVVSHKKGEPVSVKTIVIANPGRGEGGVQVQACGVSHTDLHHREGGITNEFRLGHEAVGVVEQVGNVLRASGVVPRALHSPGASCLYAPELGTVFTGDTLFQGGPDATGRSCSSFDAIIESIRDTLLALPANTTVRGTEAAHLEEWIARRH